MELFVAKSHVTRALSTKPFAKLSASHRPSPSTKSVIATFAPVPADRYGSWRLEVEAPRDLARFIAAKGSIAVDGVSLTVNGVAGERFHVNLIPHTLDATTLRRLRPGARVNLEVDLIARYVARLAEAG